MKAKNNLPDWLKEDSDYQPAKTRFSLVNFISKNIQRFTNLHKEVSKQTSSINALSFCTMILEILLISLSKSLIFIWILLIIFLFQLASKKDIRKIIKHFIIAAIMFLVLVSPMLLLDLEKFNWLFLMKTLVILLKVNIFINDCNLLGFIKILQQLHLSKTLVFILGIMVKYLSVLNNEVIDELNAIKIKSVGKFSHPYRVIGNIFGTIYLHSIAISQDVHDAMIIKGYTGTFYKVKTTKSPLALLNMVEGIVAISLFVFIR